MAVHIDWALCRSDDGRVLATFASRDLAAAHYRRLGCPPDLLVVRQEHIIRRRREYVRPLKAAANDPFAIPAMGAAA